MKNNTETIQEAIYFSSPVWVDYRPEFLKDCINDTEFYIKEARTNNKKTIKDTNDFGITHHSAPMQNNPKFLNIMGYIAQRSWEFLDAQGFDLSKHSLVFNDFWVQEFAKNGGGHHDTHVHHNNHVSGFYFLKCSEKTSFPIFHDPRPGAVMTKLPLKNEFEISHGSEAINFRPTSGTMIFFNGYIPHQFAVDHGKEPFRFIHWNMQAVSNMICKPQ